MDRFHQSINPSPWLIQPLCEMCSEEEGSLRAERIPIIAYGEGEASRADVVVRTKAEAVSLQKNINRAPQAALFLAQILRIVENLPIEQALTVESLAYASLQAGPEFTAWLNTRTEKPRLIANAETPAIDLQRRGDIVSAKLNRQENRNAITVEMRDALVELFELLLIDSSIECLLLSGHGRCFSIGGELREFGLSSNSGLAHYIRSIHNPSRLLAQCADRVHCHLHGACIGSGIEIPAFSNKLTATSNTFFQLPELNYGLIPGAGGCISIPRRIGRQRTAWLVLSGKRINATTALEWGLVDDIIES